MLHDQAMPTHMALVTIETVTVVFAFELTVRRRDGLLLYG